MRWAHGGGRRLTFFVGVSAARGLLVVFFFSSFDMRYEEGVCVSNSTFLMFRVSVSGKNTRKVKTEKDAR